MLGARSFQARLFIAILIVALVPAALAVAGGTLTLRRVGTTSGTLGAWDAVAESGRDLLDSIDEADVPDPAVEAAARRHAEALSESVRLSRQYAFIADRFVRALPFVAVLAAVLVAGLSLFTARMLSRSLAAPITDLVTWTELIARDEPLPASDPDDGTVEELRILHSALRDMASELEQGRRRAIEAARLRSWTDLARRVAHDLKNALTPIKIAAVTLTEGAESQRAEAGRILQDEVDRLDGIARTFSQYGRAPEGPRSDVDLAELLGSIAGLHRSDAVDITVDAPAGALVHGHLDALRRAFENLVVNAVEAQREAGHAHVDVQLTTSDGRASVDISDRGPGVPEELREEIWSPDVTTKRGGTGLGLSIVQQIVHIHGGSIAVAGRDGGGATFVVSLPLTPTDRT